MAQTTGAISARNCYLKVNNQDVSGSANKVTLTPKLDTEQTATFDGGWKLTTAGKLSWEIAIEALYTEVTGEAASILWGAFTGGTAVPVEVAPKGNTTGNWAFSGNVIFNSVEMPFDGTSGDPVIITAEGAGSGELTKSTVST